MPFMAAADSRPSTHAPAPAEPAAPQWLVVRGASQRMTIRACAARVITVTAMHYDLQR